MRTITARSNTNGRVTHRGQRHLMQEVADQQRELNGVIYITARLENMRRASQHGHAVRGY